MNGNTLRPSQWDVNHGFRSKNSFPRIVFNGTLLTMPKKDVQISVRLSSDALEMVRKAAEKRWPNAPVSTPATLVTFALERAEEILSKPKK